MALIVHCNIQPPAVYPLPTLRIHINPPRAPNCIAKDSSSVFLCFAGKLQVFLQAKVYFSIGGQHFSSEPVQFSYMPDAIMESARDVTIKLHHRIGRYIQVHLYFAMRWIMLSEISFVSSKYPYPECVCCLSSSLPALSSPSK